MSNRYDLFAGRLCSHRACVDLLELGVAVGMARTFIRFVVNLM